MSKKLLLIVGLILVTALQGSKEKMSLDDRNPINLGNQESQTTLDRSPKDLNIFGIHRSLQITCGDGTRDADEDCDDGNTDDGDGCSTECAIEDNFICQEGDTLGIPDICTQCPSGYIPESTTDALVYTQCMMEDDTFKTIYYVIIVVMMVGKIGYFLAEYIRVRKDKKHKIELHSIFTFWKFLQTAILLPIMREHFDDAVAAFLAEFRFLFFMFNVDPDCAYDAVTDVPENTLEPYVCLLGMEKEEAGVKEQLTPTILWIIFCAIPIVAALIENKCSFKKLKEFTKDELPNADESTCRRWLDSLLYAIPIRMLILLFTALLVSTFPLYYEEAEDRLAHASSSMIFVIIFLIIALILYLMDCCCKENKLRDSKLFSEFFSGTKDDSNKALDAMGPNSAESYLSVNLLKTYFTLTALFLFSDGENHMLASFILALLSFFYIMYMSCVKPLRKTLDDVTDMSLESALFLLVIISSVDGEGCRSNKAVKVIPHLICAFAIIWALFGMFKFGHALMHTSRNRNEDGENTPIFPEPHHESEPDVKISGHHDSQDVNKVNSQ